jgi:AcrR family transcriptional regulator
VAAGIELVEAGGPDAVTIRGVARLAGVSHTAPLHHFADRETLLRAVAERGFELLLERLEAGLGAERPGPAAELRAYGVAYVEHAAAHPGLFRLMFDGFDCPPGEEAWHRLVAMCAAAIEAGQLATPADPERLAFLVWGLVHGLGGLVSAGRGQDAGEPFLPVAVAVRAIDDCLAALVPTD